MFLTMADDSSERALRHLKAGRWEKALRFFEHSYWLRHLPSDTPSWGCAYTTKSLS